jgi:RHS repeat-associated protein
VASRIGYAGYQYDPTFVGASRAIYHVRNRVYDAGLGRWLRRDPAGYVDGVSLVEYLGGLPHLLRDVFGLSASSCPNGDKPTPCLVNSDGEIIRPSVWHWIFKIGDVITRDAKGDAMTEDRYAVATGLSASLDIDILHDKLTFYSHIMGKKNRDVVDYSDLRPSGTLKCTPDGEHIDFTKDNGSTWETDNISTSGPMLYHGIFLDIETDSMYWWLKKITMRYRAKFVDKSIGGSVGGQVNVGNGVFNAGFSANIYSDKIAGGIVYDTGDTVVGTGYWHCCCPGDWQTKPPTEQTRYVTKDNTSGT